MYYSRPKQFERFRGVLELITGFEFDFRRRGNYFLNDSNCRCVQKFNHPQCGPPCACAVACLHPHNSISNVVVSLTIHDNLKNIFIFSKKPETIVEGHKHIHVRIHVHFHTHTHKRIPVHRHVLCVLLVLPLRVVVVVSWWRREGRRRTGGDKPNHVTTDSLRSVPQHC